MTPKSLLNISGMNDGATSTALFRSPSRRFSAKLPQTLLTFLAIFFAFSLSTNAATFTVNTLADNESNGCIVGTCTLREAVSDANSLPGADTIAFQSGLTGTITLTSAQGGQLLITSSVTINGPGARLLTVSGGGTSRVFQINPLLLAPTTTANISGLTITSGNGAVNTLAGVPLTPGPGGGILNTGGATLNLSEVNLTGNNIPIYSAVSSNLLLGGGVATLGTDLTPTTTNITRSIIANNSAVGGGGGVSNAGTGILLLGATTTITNSTITENVTAATGGGVVNIAGELNLVNTTISDNTAVLLGGGVTSLVGTLPSILGVTNLRNSIIARNNAQLVGGVLSLSNDVLGVLGSFNSLGHNLIGNNFNASASFAASVFVGGICQPNAQLDLVGSVSVGTTVIDPRLGAVGDNGGPTNSKALLVNSPALDAGDNCVVNAGSNPCGTPRTPSSQLTTDQRGTGFTRQIGTAVDIGAFEGQGTPTDRVLVVNSLADTLPDGCDVAGCTLREAILDANATSGADTIVFSPSVSGGTVTLGSGAGFGELLISDSVTIIGPNGCARNITVSGNNTSRVFHVNPAILGRQIVVTIQGLTVTNGNGATNTLLGLPVLPGAGGGILNEGGGTLNLLESSVSGNHSEILGIIPTNLLVGGGVATIGTDLAKTNTYIARSLISGNSAAGGGGGVSNAGTGTLLDALASTTRLSNTTITNNDTVAAGGGVLNAAGTIYSTNTTISHNRATLLAGGVVNVVGIPLVGTTALRNTIISNNTDLLGLDLLFPDTAGIFNSMGNNLIGNNGLLGLSVGLTANVTILVGIPTGANVDIVGSIQIGFVRVNPLLGALQNNGGCTNTRSISAGSPAVDRGTNCVANGTCQTYNPMEPVLYTGQRGYPYVRMFDGDSNGTPTVDIGAYELQFSPSAANSVISGRVSDGIGNPLSRIPVTLTDQDGAVRTAVSNNFGRFTFNEVESGQSYIIGVSTKKFNFSSRIINVEGDLTEVELVPDVEQKQVETQPKVIKKR